MKKYSVKMLFVVIVLTAGLSLGPAPARAEALKLNMVFVPASEKGDEKDYVNLIKIIGNLTGYEIKPIRITDYNAAVEAMRAGRAQIAWYGGKTYIVAAKLADATAMVRAAKESGKILHIAIHSRYQPGIVMSRRSIGDLIPLLPPLPRKPSN